MKYPVHRTRVKICGLTRPEDARTASAMGVDAVGLVFYRASPRAVTHEQAAAILAELGPFVTSVGLFVNAAVEEVRRVLERLPLDLLQFHGEETPDYCAGFERPYIKAIRMRDDADLDEAFRRYRSAQALLLDAYQDGEQGGTGCTFDWHRARISTSDRIILAGGLTVANVKDALELVRPFAVDVSSGTESAKGVKDPEKMAGFLREVYEFDHRQRSR